MTMKLQNLWGARDDGASDAVDLARIPVSQVAAHVRPSIEVWTTLFVTDLQGSTALWREDSVAMERSLAVHDFVLQNLVECFGGVVFKTAGDAILAVFRDVASALECALKCSDFLRRLDRFFPRCRLGSRLRIVIHVGRVFVRDHDCFGEEVCYASRLVAVAPAREILVSEAALFALDRWELPSLRFEVLRVEPVRDFGEGGEVYRVERGPPGGGPPTLLYPE